MSASRVDAERRARAVAVQTFLEFKNGTLRYKGRVVVDPKEASMISMRRELRCLKAKIKGKPKAT